MNKKTDHTNKKKARRKWPWILLLCIIGLIGVLRLALLGGPLHQWLKNTIVDTANEQLKPKLSIDNISGDLWKGATLTDVRLTEDSTVASIDTLHLEYSPLSYFSDAFQIHKIRISRPFISLTQQQDSTWNVQYWVTTTDTSSDTTGATFAFSIVDLSIDRGRLDIAMPQLAQDSSFTVDDLALSSSIGFFGESYSANLDALNFNIKNTALDSLVSVSVAADANASSVTLGKLAIATGHSVLQASGEASLTDSTARFQADASPVGWRDLAAYAEDMSVQEDINISVGLEGNASEFEININANATGIEQLSLQSRFRSDSLLMLTSLQASARRLDLESFMGDTSMPGLSDLEFKSQGRLPLEQYQQGQLDGTFSAANIQQGSYRLDRLQGTFSLEKDHAKIKLEPLNGREQLVANADILQIWEEMPRVRATIEGSKINPANWLQDDAYAGNLSFKAEVNGAGWFPGDNFWNYQLTLDKSRLMDQCVDRATFSGRFNQQMVTNRSKITVGESGLQLQAEARQLQTMPAFSYTINASDINLADFNGMDDYPSSLTATIRGRGQGSSLEDLDMETSIEADSSLIRGEVIRDVLIDMQISDAIVNIRNGTLKSDIADGNFQGRFHLQNYYDAGNSLNLNMELKDLSSFASVADVEVLQAAGTISGKLTASGQDSLILESMINLQDINYDEQFVAPEISGGLRVNLAEEPEYLVDFNIANPTIASLVLQNIRLKTEGRYGTDTTSGSFGLELAGEEKERIAQQGTYQLSGDSVSVALSEFDLTSPLRTLSLQKPFHVTFANSALQTDTLHLSSDDRSTFMELAVPFADSLHQKGYLRAQNLNLEVIQNAALDEAYFKGTLFGEFQVDRTDTSLVASGDIVMSDLLYEETALDTLQLQADIQNERLKGLVELHQGGELIVDGNLDIPFKAQDLEQLEEDFFDQPVNGQLKLHTIKLSRFNTLLEQAGYENTEGTLQFDGYLEGRAGEPKFGAALDLREAKLSGVSIDSLIASVDYDHTKSMLNLKAALASLRQKALEVDGQMPLNVDLHSWDIGLPSPEESISVSIRTNQFNLKALNGFMNQDMARNLEGRINGEIEILGPREDLKTSGEITLQKGAVRVVPVDIRLDNMASTIRFNPDEIELVNLGMKSGSGNLNAAGTLALDQLVPGDIDLTVKAQNFKVSNTDEYNGIINLDVKMDGSVTKPTLSGQLDVVNGFVELDNFGEKSVEEVSLDTTLTPEPDISMYDSLSLDMDVAFNRRFFVRNQRYLEMELELDGQIDLLKEAGGELQMFGTLNTANGYAEPLGKRFELEEGSLAFSGPIDNPQVNIRTLYEPPQEDQEIKIWYVIEGTVEDPQFKYESSPSMDLAGIISYTLFGQPFYKLNPAEQSVASSSSNNSAADFAVEVLLDRVESLATRRLGIDVVRIENTRVGGESGTSITTGWYINPKVFFAIQNVITGTMPTTGFYLEYYLKKNLKLILSQDNDNRQGIDLQWKHDY